MPASAGVLWDERLLWAQVILYSFPAVCWLYGAGFLFSLFASFVFWASPIQHLVETTRRRATIVRPVGLKVRGLSLLAGAALAGLTAGFLTLCSDLLLGAPVMCIGLPATTFTSELGQSFLQSGRYPQCL